MSVHEFAAAATATYFFGFGAGFLFRPELADRLGLRWTNRAGRTEIRCYYGAVSWALGSFLLYLSVRDQAADAVTLGLFLSTAVLVSRVVGTLVDGGWSDEYTKLALPTEAVFVAALLVARVW